MALTTILGASGPISNELVKILAASGTPMRLVSRRPRPAMAGTETLAADISDRKHAIRAVAGSHVVHLLVGLKYEVKVWQEQWPCIMANTIEACKRAGAKDGRECHKILSAQARSCTVAPVTAMIAADF